MQKECQQTESSPAALFQFLRDIAATLSSCSGGSGGGREAAASAWYSSSPVPEPPCQTYGLAEGALAVLARPQWQVASWCPNSPSGSMAAQQPARQVPSLNRSVRLSCQPARQVPSLNR